jgi:hypothetical protein
VANKKWLDRTQPQTLYSATILLYFNAFWWLLGLMQSGYTYIDFLGIAILSPLLAIGAVLCGVGIANDRREGYYGGLLIAVLNLAALAVWFFAVEGRSIQVILNLIFGVALLALLLHPSSRNYQGVWFKGLSGLEKAVGRARVRRAKRRRGWH